MHTVNKNPSVKDVRTFGLTIFAGLSVIGGLLYWVGTSEETGWAWTGAGTQWLSGVLGAIGTVVGVICVTSHGAGKPIYVVWMSAAMYMGMVMVPLFLTLLYILVLPVFSLIRLKDPLRFKLKSEGSYWEPHRPHEPTLERMRRPF